MDDLDTRGPRDTGWINLEEPREVRYWTRALAVTEAQLRAAVCAAGDSTQAVCRYLGVPRANAGPRAVAGSRAHLSG
jgi:hypothetical protein